MSDIYQVSEETEVIKIELVENHLKHEKGQDFIGRIANQQTYDVEQICAHMKNRSGFEGDMGQLITSVKHFIQETLYQLISGHAVTNDYFTLRLNVGGTFADHHSQRDPAKNPFTVRFRAKKSLKDILTKLKSIIIGQAEADACVTSYLDTEENEVNAFIPGHLFIIHGNLIKIDGADPENGLYLVPVEVPGAGPMPAPVKVTRFSDNTSTKLSGLLPENINWPSFKVEVRTQFSSGGNLLKEPRIITSRFTIEQI